MGYNAQFPPGKNTAINVRTIQDLDIWKLEINPYENPDCSLKYRAHD